MDQHSEYPFAEVETRWQTRWAEARAFEARPRPELPRWSVLDVPPFPNGPLHMGHARTYFVADSIARFRRMAGYDVLYANGFDAFGLPNDNSAREHHCHPREWTERCIERIRRQFTRFGLSHDARRVRSFHEPDYYRWTQWLFLKLFERGLVVRRRATTPWCPSCATTVARTSALNGCCDRCSTPVETRILHQWYVREIEFAESLLDGITRLDEWPDHVKRIQQNLIGRVEGLCLRLELDGGGAHVDAFAARPELALDAEFVGVDPLHPFVDELRRHGRIDGALDAALAQFAERPLQASRRNEGASSEVSAAALDLRVVLRHPLGGRPLPLLALRRDDLRADTDAVFGAPAHSPSDRRIAERLGLRAAANGRAHVSAEERERAAAALVASGAARRAVRYGLHDWNVSRQRYWGPPIPIVHCSACGIVGVPERELPVLLPDGVDLDYRGNPLERLPSFVETRCPRCAGPARRETDTLDTFFNSSWLHVRYTAHPDAEAPFADPEIGHWLPANVAVGGDEQHTTAFFHNRVITRALRDFGCVPFDEACTSFLPVGMVMRHGKKMSKRAGNSVHPDDLIDRHGADALRLAVYDAARPGSSLEWSDKSVPRFQELVQRMWTFYEKLRASEGLDFARCEPGERDRGERHKSKRWLDTAIHKTTKAMLQNQPHVATQNVVVLLRRIEEFEALECGLGAPNREDQLHFLAEAARALVLLVAPLAPHLAEELWARCGGRGFVAHASWPAARERAAPERPRARAAERMRAAADVRAE